MSTVLKEYLVKLGFETDKSGAAGFSSAVSSAGKSLALIGGAAVAAAGAITAFVTSIADGIDQLGDMSARTGEAVGAIDKMGYIAQLTGSSVEASNSSIEELSKNIGLMAMDMGRAKPIFEQLGISVKKQNGDLKSATEVMGELRESLKGMEGGQQIAVLERLGIDRTMIGALTQDVSGLSDEYDAMQKASGFSMEEAAASAGDYMDSMDRMGLLLKKLRQAIAVPFFKGITQGMNTMRKMLLENMPKIISTITPIIRFILSAADLFLFFAGQIIKAVGWIISPLLELNRMLGGIPAYILAAAAAWKVFNLGFLATPIGAVIGMVIALAAAIALLKDDFDTWKAGGESLIDWEVWMPAIEAAQAGLAAFRGFLTDWFSALGAMFDALFALLSGDFAGAWEGVKSMLGSVMDMFSGLINIAEKVGGVIGSVAGGISAIVGGKSALTPSAATTGAGGTQNVNQQTVINVNGAGNAEAVGKAVAGQQGGVNNQLQRNLQGSVR